MKNFSKFKKLISFVIFLPFVFILSFGQLNYLEKNLNKPSFTKKTNNYDDSEYVNSSVIEEVALGDEFSGAIINGKTTDHLYMWGDNSEGQLGLGDEFNDGFYNFPQEVTLLPEGDIKQIALGKNYSAAIVNANEDKIDYLYTWGNNSEGQLGINKITDYENTPQLVKNLSINKSIEQVALGTTNSAAIVKDATGDHLYTWGLNDKGQLGLGDWSRDKNFSYPKEIEKFQGYNIEQVALGDSYGATVINEQNTDYLYTWGDNSKKQLGLGSDSNDKFFKPQKVKALPKGNIEQISLGSSHSAAIVNNDLYTWGDNSKSQLGFGNPSSPIDTPKKVTSLEKDNSKITQVSLGNFHSSAIVEDERGDHLYTWGNNDNGQLGYEENSNNYPKEVKALPFENIEQISMGGAHSAAIINDGINNSLYMWGNNDNGQLANNFTDNNQCYPQFVWESSYLVNTKTKKELSPSSNFEEVTIYYEFKTNLNVQEVKISLFDSKTSNYINDNQNIYSTNSDLTQTFYSDELLFSNLEESKKYDYEIMVYYYPISKGEPPFFSNKNDIEQNCNVITITKDSFKNNFFYQTVWFPFAIIFSTTLFFFLCTTLFILWLKTRRIVISKK